MEKKMTYVTAIDVVLDGGELTEEVIAKLTALRDSIAKKNASKGGKPSKEQRENAKVKVAILKALPAEGEAEGIRCGEVAQLVGITQNRASALLTQMVEAGTVHREVVKRAPLFTRIGEIPAEPAEEDTPTEE